MRSESEMLNAILSFANADDRVRAVIMNGSRVNPDAPRDIFQDYDIVFIVTNVDVYKEDRSWISYFGKLIIMQTPDEMGSTPSSNNDRFAFLMLFQDGNRIDLTLYSVEKINILNHESLSKVLLDKDGILGALPAPNNSDYLTNPPNQKEFADCCNEFWWVCTYIAKGLWRKELAYAKYMFERPVRDMLILMLKWYIGIRKGYSVDTGKYGKYFKKYLEPETWNSFVKTFPDGNYETIWEALFNMINLFRDTSREVAEYHGYNYPVQDDHNVTSYLRHVKNLPQDAEDIF